VLVRAVLAALLIVVALPASALAEDNGLYQAGALGDLTVEMWLAPGVYRPTAVELHLTDAGGQAPSDVRRVDLQFAMAGMNHGARGVEAERVEPGVYQAAGYLLAMPGAWWLAVRVERADGRLHQARYAFVTPAEPATNASFALDGRPEGIFDLVASPGELIPSQIEVQAGRPVRLELMYVDEPGCGRAVLVAETGDWAAVTADGLAELSFVPARTGPLTLSCTPSALLLRR
jgi:hypothetical protein